MKVRIAVAIDPYGGWCSFGAYGKWDKQLSDDEMARFAREGVQEGERIYFLEADLEQPPLPKEPEKPVTVMAEVVMNNWIDKQ